MKERFKVRIDSIKHVISSVLVLAFFVFSICFLPSTKARAWTAGSDTATLHIVFDMGGGTEGLYPEEMIVTAQPETNEYYNFSIPAGTFNKAPALNGCLAEHFEIVDYSSFYFNYTPELQIQGNISIGNVVNSINYVSSSFFNEDGEATITLAAVYGTTPIQASYKFFTDDIARAQNIKYSETDTQGNTMYFFDLNVPENTGAPSSVGKRVLTGEYQKPNRNDVVIYDTSNNVIASVYTNGRYVLVLNSASDRNITFTPVYGGPDYITLTVEYNTGANATFENSTETVRREQITFIRYYGYYKAAFEDYVPNVDGKNGYVYAHEWIKDESMTNIVSFYKSFFPYEYINSQEVSSRFEIRLNEDYLMENDYPVIKLVPKMRKVTGTFKIDVGGDGAIDQDDPVFTINAVECSLHGDYVYDVTLPVIDADYGYVFEGYTIDFSDDMWVVYDENFIPDTDVGRGVAVLLADGYHLRIAVGDNSSIADDSFEMILTAILREHPKLRVNFADVAGQFIYPDSDQSDDDGLLLFTINVPNITSENSGFGDGFGAVFVVNSIIDNETRVYKGNDELSGNRVLDSEDITIHADFSESKTIDWRAERAIKSTGEYVVSGHTVYLTRGSWTVSDEGVSDGYTYSVSEPALINAGNHQVLTFAKR